MPEKLTSKDNARHAALSSLRKLAVEGQNCENREYGDEIETELTESFLYLADAFTPLIGLNHADAFLHLTPNTPDVVDRPLYMGEKGQPVHVELFLPFQQARYVVQSPHNRLTPQQREFLPQTDEFDGIASRVAFLLQFEPDKRSRRIDYTDGSLQVSLTPLGKGQGRLTADEMVMLDTRMQNIAEYQMNQGAPLDTEIFMSAYRIYAHAADEYMTRRSNDITHTSAWMTRETRRVIDYMKVSEIRGFSLIRGNFEDIALSDDSRGVLFYPEDKTSKIRLSSTGEVDVVPSPDFEINPALVGDNQNADKSYPLSSHCHVSLMPVIIGQLEKQIPKTTHTSSST